HRAAGVRASADGRHVGVPGDQAHLVQLDAEPLGEELREARLVALAGRLRAHHDVDAALGPHGDLGALVRHAGVELEVVGQADAAVTTAPAGLGPPRLGPGPVR